MKKLELQSGKRALVIVAHPDDETIWMGGTIRKHSDVRWTIFSLCRASDADRAPKFRRVCRLYGAKAIITDLEDEDELSVEQTIPIIKKLIIKKAGSREFDYIFTHGANGEYGHPRHIGAHLAVKELVSDKILKSKQVYFFNYEKAKEGKRPSMTAKKDSDYILNLSKSIFNTKKRLQAEIHGYEWNGIDNSLCTNPEAFILRR